MAPPGKRAKAYLWSGDTTPFPAAIKAVRKAGARNINGGDSRLDARISRPSPTCRRCRGRPGAERQIYAGNSNENTYTNDWTGPYYGFFMLEHTLANTELPRRLKPFNLYYHMYSGEKPSALAAVRHFLELARRKPGDPDRGLSLRGDRRRFLRRRNRAGRSVLLGGQRTGRAQTVRFDDAEQLARRHRAQLDGVLGSTRHEGALSSRSIGPSSGPS